MGFQRHPVPKLTRFVTAPSGKVVVPRACAFCQARAGAGELTCRRCKRPLDWLAMREEAQRKDKEFGICASQQREPGGQDPS